MEEEQERRDYIVYLETDVTVSARTLREAERLAKLAIKSRSVIPQLVRIDETRVITSEKIGHYKSHAKPKEQRRTAPVLEEGS
jgi:hypothetical protein